MEQDSEVMESVPIVPLERLKERIHEQIVDFFVFLIKDSIVGVVQTIPRECWLPRTEQIVETLVPPLRGGELRGRSASHTTGACESHEGADRGGASPPDHGGRVGADRGSPCDTNQGGHRRSSSLSRATGHGGNLTVTQSVPLERIQKRVGGHRGSDSACTTGAGAESSRAADRECACARDHEGRRSWCAACAPGARAVSRRGADPECACARDHEGRRGNDSACASRAHARTSRGSDRGRASAPDHGRYRGWYASCTTGARSAAVEKTGLLGLAKRTRFAAEHWERRQCSHWKCVIIVVTRLAQ